MRARRIAATIAATAAFASAGVLAASASPSATSCRGTAGYVVCSSVGSDGPARTLAGSLSQVAAEVAAGVEGGNWPMPT